MIKTECQIPSCYDEAGGNTVQSFLYCMYHNNRWQVFRRRGFAPERFEELMTAEQCEICGVHSNRLFMDHDHSCCGAKTFCPNCVRGMLCTRCNQMMATIDDPDWLARGIKYKKDYPIDPEKHIEPPSARPSRGRPPKYRKMTMEAFDKGYPDDMLNPADYGML